LSAGKKKKRKVRETNDESEQEMAAEEGRDGAAVRGLFIVFMFCNI
jgi:hypothetical protein